MKYLFFLFILLVSLSPLEAQNPDLGIHYQTVVRNADGLVKDMDVEVVFIISSTPTDFTETHQTRTNAYGLINLVIGSVDPVNFANIDWSSEQARVQVQMNFGDGLVDFGTTNFQAVPYALRTTNMKIEDITNIDLTNVQNGDILIYDGGTWITGSSQQQILELNGNTLSLSPGNSVNLDDITTGGDGWGNQVVESDATIDGNGSLGEPLMLSSQNANSGQVLKWNGNSWMPSNDIDTDTNTDAQNLSISGNNLTISNGNTVNLDDITTGGDGWGNQVAESDATIDGNGSLGEPLMLSSQNANSGQVLKWNGSSWMPSNDIDTDTNTDAQNLSVSGNNLTISNGNTVALPMNGDGDITAVVAGTGITGGGGSGSVTLNAQTNSALWNANKLQSIDVEISDPEFGQVLAYDSNTDKFVNTFQLDADFVPAVFDDVSTLSSLATVVSNIGSDVDLVGVSGNIISGNPLGSHVAIDGNEIMAKISEFGTGVLYLQASGGEVKIGGSGAASHLLHVTGVARSTQSTWATSSDKRVKKNIIDVTAGIDKIMALRPVRFDWKNEYKKENASLNDNNYGFIAQEVRKVVPEMISEVKEVYGDKTIEDFNLLNLDPLFPLLVKAIQEQQDKIQQQDKTIDLLNTRLTALESAINN